MCNAESLQLCMILCNPMDHSLLDPSVHGILQVRILEWVAMPFFRGSSDPGMELASLTSPDMAREFFLPLAPPGRPQIEKYDIFNNQLSSRDFFFDWSLFFCLIHRVIYLEYQAWSFKLPRLKKNLPINSSEEKR